MSTPAGNNSFKPIQSVVRASSILRCFIDAQELSLHEICDLVGLHKTTAFTIITTLKMEGLLEQNPNNSKYHLGLGAFQLSTHARIGLRSVVMPYLYELRDTFEETVNLSVPSGPEILYLDKVESNLSIRICTSVGQSLPFYCTAAGKAMFAYYPDDVLEALLSMTTFTSFTRNTITDLRHLREELALSRLNRYAMDYGELEEGLVCCAVPILDRRNQPVAAISVSGPMFRMDDTKVSAVRDKLFACTNRISAVMT